MKKFSILIAIVVLGAALRLWALGNIPPGITQDEAALGYNAYSILKTGRDEYGKLLPVVFKSFGDYKPGLYIYFDVPFVAALGLNEVAVRLPSALAGIILIYLVYLIASRLFDRNIGLLTAFTAAINPWLIFYSRGAWEVNVSLTLTLAGIYFFLRALEKTGYLFISAVFFASTLLMYQGAKLSTAIVVILLGVIYWRGLIKIRGWHLLGSIMLGILFSLPIILSLFTGQSGRLEVFSVFSYPRPPEYTQKMLDQGSENFGDVNFILFHSEPLNFARGIMGRWANHFSGRFLFFEGDYQNPQHSPPYHGMLLITDLVFLIAGAFLVFGNYSKNPTPYAFILIWLLLSPLPAAISRDQVSSVRALNMATPLVFVLGFGIQKLFQIIKNSLGSKLGYATVILVLTFGIGYFLDAFFVHLPVHNSKYWNYGFKEMVQYVTDVQSKYSKVKIQQSYSQPYIYFLFYQKYDPVRYQAKAKLVSGANIKDVGFVENLDNIYFTDVNWASNKAETGTLLVGDPVALPENENMIYQIRLLNGSEAAFNIIEVK